MIFKTNHMRVLPLFWVNLILILNSACIIHALAYSLVPNRIIETWLCSLLIYRYATKKLWYAFLIFCSLIIILYHPTAILYGRPTLSLIASFISTNHNEASEFLHAIPASIYLQTLGLACIPLLTLTICARLPKPKWSWYWGIGFIIIIAVMIFSTSRHPHSDKETPFRVQPFEFFINLYPRCYEYFTELKKLKAGIDLPDQWTINGVEQHYKNYILVIGESARADYHHLYGFKYHNTPFLDQHANLMMDNMLSPASGTIISLLNGLTLSHGKGPNIQNNIITLANKAGMETIWLSNQGAIGKYDTSVSIIGHYASQSVFLKKTGSFTGDGTNKLIQDIQLLPHLKQILSQPATKNRLIVLHLMGSHPNPCYRIRSEPRHYVNNKDSNCYIDSIKQTDYLLSQVYAQLQQTQQPFSLFYFSDHGLSHDTKEAPPGLSLLRHNDQFYQNYHIPLIIINSNQSGLTHNPAHRSGLYLIDGIAAWLGISSPQLPYSQDFFSQRDSEPLQVLNFSKQLKPARDLKDDPLPAELR